jgi:hypothetical protein
MAHHHYPLPISRLGYRQQPVLRRRVVTAGKIQGVNSYADYISENDAVLFAFMSMIHPDEDQRADYAQRARTLLLHVMTEAAKGSASGEPFRDPDFSVNNRCHACQSFPLMVKTRCHCHLRPSNDSNR